MKKLLLFLLILGACTKPKKTEAYQLLVFHYNNHGKITGDLCYKFISGKDTVYYAPTLDTVFRAGLDGVKKPSVDSSGRIEAQITYYLVPERAILLESSKKFRINPDSIYVTKK